jgi:hypothetical protein
MFSSFISALRKMPSRAPRRVRLASRKLVLESLEDRTVPSGGSASPSGSTPGGSGPPLVTVVIQGGGPGPSIISGSNGGSGSTGNGSGDSGISGPGYPFPPTGGPVRPDAGAVTQTPTAVLIPLNGAPSGPTVVVGPVTT